MTIQVTPGLGKTVATDTINGLEYQQVEIIGQVSVVGTISVNPSSVSGTVGASIIGTVPVVQGGTWGASVVGQVNIGSVIGAIPLYANPDSLVFGAPSVFTTTSSVQLLASPGSNLRNYVTHILATNTGAVATTINIVDVGQVIYSGYAAASGGGFSATLPAPLKQPTQNVALYVGMTTTSSVIVSASGYKAT